MEKDDFFEEIAAKVAKASNRKHRQRPKSSKKKHEMDSGKTKEQILAERKAKKTAKKEVKAQPKVEGQGSSRKVETAPKTLDKTKSNSPLKESETMKPLESNSSSESAKTVISVSNQESLKSEETLVGMPEGAKVEKTRELILLERETKKLAKQSKKKGEGEPINKVVSNVKIETSTLSPALSGASTISHGSSDIVAMMSGLSISPESSSEQATESSSNEPPKDSPTDCLKEKECTSKAPKPIETGEFPPKKPPMTKAERRALQEAQRAAKQQLADKKNAALNKKVEEWTAKNPPPKAQPEPLKASKSLPTKPKPVKPKAVETAAKTKKVKLFSHLYTEKNDLKFIPNSKTVHPAMITLGVKYARKIIVGGNARCISFLEACKELVRDYEVPEQSEFNRGLEFLLTEGMNFLKSCRPASVSMVNALRYIKWQMTLLKKEDSDAANKETLLDTIDTYVRDQIEKAGQAIMNILKEKIKDGDIILTYGCSSIVTNILLDTKKRGVNFRVIIVDSTPRHEGQILLKKLTYACIRCTITTMAGVSFAMPEASLVLLGAHGLLANGHVMSRVGTAQVAMVAKAYGKPVLVCCETHKFSERVQMDAFVYNEIGDPQELVLEETPDWMKDEDPIAKWNDSAYLTPLNLMYDVTPPELVTAVVTEIGILPCTVAPVILRIKPSEIGY